MRAVVLALDITVVAVVKIYAASFCVLILVLLGMRREEYHRFIVVITVIAIIYVNVANIIIIAIDAIITIIIAEVTTVIKRAKHMLIRLRLLLQIYVCRLKVPVNNSLVVEGLEACYHLSSPVPNELF